MKTVANDESVGRAPGPIRECIWEANAGLAALAGNRDRRTGAGFSRRGTAVAGPGATTSKLTKSKVANIADTQPVDGVGALRSQFRQRPVP